MHPAKRVTPATRAVRVSNFFITTTSYYIKIRLTKCLTHPLYKKICSNCKSIIDIFLEQIFRHFDYMKIILTNDGKNRIIIFTYTSFIWNTSMERTQTKIVTMYKKVSRFFFHYLIFFFAFIIGFFLFQSLLNKSLSIDIFQGNDTLLIQKTKLIAEFI